MPGIKKILLVICILIQGIAFAGPERLLNGNLPLHSTYAVLPDQGYTFQQIQGNNNLPFVTGDSLRPYKSGIYWVKIIIANPNLLSGQYGIEIAPALINTLYYFDAERQKWQNGQAGILTNKSIGRNEQDMVFTLPAKAADTLFVKMDVTRLQKFGFATLPGITITPATVINERMQILRDGWLIAMSVLVFFILYNLYIYFSLRDISVLYYLVIQVGAIIYITTYRQFVRFFFPAKLYQIELVRNGKMRYYDSDHLLQHVGIILIIYGFVQLSRVYLNAKTYFPKLNAVLVAGLYFYILTSVVLMIINTNWIMLETYTIPYDNLYLLLLTSIIIALCIAGYRRKLRAAGPFLLANVLPLLLMILITAFHLFVSLDGRDDLWLPNLAIVLQSFAFSVVLVTRTKLIEKDLREKDIEARELTFQLREIELQHSLIELENEKINLSIQSEKDKNELLQQKLESNQRELASTTLYIVQKNELLAKLKHQIEELNKLSPNNKYNSLPGIESILQSNLYLDDDWGKFKLHFEQVHPRFFEELNEKYPNLTKNEIRLHAYFHINLSTKEIAALLNIAPASVRIAKARLHKKMGVNDEAGA